MIDRPWLTALEMQFAALRTFIQDAGTSTNPNPKGQAIRNNSIIAGLRTAETFSWSFESSAAVLMASRTLPADSSLARNLPCSTGWWFFGITDILPFAALLFHSSPDLHQAGILITLFRSDVVSSANPPHIALFPYVTFLWGFGESITQVEASSRRSFENAKELHQPVSVSIRLFLAGLTWMQQRVITSSLGHIERHRRKQLAREHNAPVASDVKVIQLRRTESQSRSPNAAGDPVEWSCRWLVNGHWRNQYYGTSKERKLIYIMPYVKGPEDMPLRVPTHTVYEVSR